MHSKTNNIVGWIVILFDSLSIHFNSFFFFFWWKDDVNMSMLKNHMPANTKTVRRINFQVSYWNVLLHPDHYKWTTDKSWYYKAFCGHREKAHLLKGYQKLLGRVI